MLSIASGIDIYTLSKLLGHAKVITTEVYAKLADEKKREDIDKLPVFS